MDEFSVYPAQYCGSGSLVFYSGGGFSRVFSALSSLFGVKWPKMVVPGQGSPYAGVTAVWGHFSPFGPLYGPQMGRYAPDPQRGECAADLGLAAGAEKLQGTQA